MNKWKIPKFDLMPLLPRNKVDPLPFLLVAPKI